MFEVSDISCALKVAADIKIKDSLIDEVSIDSRTIIKPSKAIFFALQGFSRNGNAYIEELYCRGVRNFVTSDGDIARHFDANFWVVDNVVTALQQLSLYWRNQIKTPIIAVTGSNGKTIVKEWIWQLSPSNINVYRSPRSYNSQIGVPLSLLGINNENGWSVIEAGISKPGEMQQLQSIILPQIGVFTHLGEAHDENFAGKDEKLREKSVLFKDCKLVICRKNEVSDKLSSLVACPLFLWGDNADISILSNAVAHGRRSVSVKYSGKQYSFVIPFADDASFENCMNAISTLVCMGVSMDSVIEKVKDLQPIAMRMEIKDGVNGSVLINDYYNSDPASFRLAMNMLESMDVKHRKAVIMSDFVDFVGNERDVYAQVASFVRTAHIDTFVGIGEAISSCRSYFLLPHCRFYKNTESFLKQENKDDYKDMQILVKGARRFRFEYIADFLQKQSHVSVLEVNLDAMGSNLKHFRSLLPATTKIAVMVKASAYGAGSVEVANYLQNNGVSYLMVAFADEGVELRLSGINIPIAVMNPEPEDFDNMIEFNLEPEIYSLDLLQAFDKSLVRHGVENYPVHLKMNTGMNRSGIDENEVATLIAFFKERRHVRPLSMFSHLAVSDDPSQDDFTYHQFSVFEKMTSAIQSVFDYKIIRHILNSAGIERFPQYAFDMVRLGIGIHGISANNAHLEPVSSFKSYIAAIRNVPMNQTVGYGRRGVLKRDSRIAVVPIGYADGLNRHLSCGVGEFFVAGKRVPIVGNVCMDACMVDVTDVNVSVGDEVELFGKNILVTEVSDKLNTIPYEVLTSISHRIKRVYYKE